MRLTNSLLLVLGTRAAIAQRPETASTLSRRIEYWNPAWSPDGRTLVFESNVHGNESVYLINRDGSGLQRITIDTSASYQPSWAPDGERIVFSSDRAGHGDLYLIRRDGSGLQRLTTMPSGGYYQSSFSPDGRWITFQGRPDNGLTADRVFVINVDGSGLRQLTDSSYGAEGPRWTRDGKAISFLKVPYPRRLWREMADGDLDKAKAGQQMMSVRLDGSALTPLPVAPAGESEVTWSRDGSRGFFVATREGTQAIFEKRRGATTSRRVVATSVVPSGFEPSPDGLLLAYTKDVNGSAGLYVYNVSTGAEQLLTGGPSAGPIGYLRTAQLTAAIDTFETFTTPRAGGDRAPSDSYVRSMTRIGAQRWDITDTWIDTSGRARTRQSLKTKDGSLATEMETVRADRDSASLLIALRRITAWVVPEGESAKLFDGPPAGERYATPIVISAIARSRPAIGATFLAPIGTLFGPNPLVPNVDTFRVVTRETLRRNGTPLPVVVIERNSGGTRWWVDEASGAQVAARGNAGPQRYWWHLRRGFDPPKS